MDWLKRAWSWVSTGKRWLIFPALVAGIGALIALARGRRAVPPPGSAPGAGALTGSDAADARETIRETSDAEAAAIRRQAEAERERLRKVLGRIVR